MNDATTWDEMRKALIKSSETGQNLTQFGVPVNVNALLLQNLTELVRLLALKNLNLLHVDARKTIDAFLQEEPQESLAVSAPEAYGYEFQRNCWTKS